MHVRFRWVVQHSFGWTPRLCRLAQVYERLSVMLVRLRVLAFAILMLVRFVAPMERSA
jgi:hypothetical protein